MSDLRTWATGSCHCLTMTEDVASNATLTRYEAMRKRRKRIDLSRRYIGQRDRHADAARCERKQNPPGPSWVRALLEHRRQGQNAHHEIANDPPNRDRESQEHRVRGLGHCLAVEPFTHCADRMVAGVGVNEQMDMGELY